MSRKLILISFPVVFLIAVYFLGPAPHKPKWDKSIVQVPSDPTTLENYIANHESQHTLKPDNEARIIWADSSKGKTPFSVVYLHGFSSSQKEGDPIHLQFAKEFGCNLYLTRLADHGIDTTEQLLNFTGDRLWQSAKEALAVGKAIGDRVILLSTSTGGTMAIMLAAEYPEDVFAMINMSPNLAINQTAAWLLNNPWGLQIARQVMGSNYYESKLDSARKIYWNTSYRIESLVQLQEILEDKMNMSTYKRVTCPSLTLYYYKNEQEQDQTVKVSAMLEMHKQLGTPDSLKVAVPVPNAGFHVMGSYLVSKDLETVLAEAKKFAVEKLGMKPVD
jgi:pimeloyl-ACP methyl ester carboxylesterase